MKITLFGSDLSSNQTGRCHIFSKILEKYHDVEIIGFSSSDKLWRPIRNENLNIKNYGKISFFNIRIISEKIINDFDSDLLIISNRLLSNYWIGNQIHKKTKVPVILDIADIDIAEFMDERLFNLYLKDKFKFSTIMLVRFFTKIFKKGIIDFYRNFTKLDNLFYKLYCDRHSEYFENITVNSNTLKRIYGGEVIRDGQDIKRINYDYKSGLKIRKVLGISKSDFVITFLGTPHLHKGFLEVANAISLLNIENIKYLFIGISKRNPYYREMKDFLGEKLISLEGVAFEDIGKYYSATDLVVLNHRSHSYGLGQIPAKLYDAIATKTPLICSSFADREDVLRGNYIDLKNNIVSLTF